MKYVDDMRRPQVANVIMQKADERRDKTDLNLRLKQLSKLILTSQTVDVGTDSGSVSPTKLDFDLSPYQVCTRN